MTKEHQELKKSKLMFVAVVSITASVLSASILPAFAVNNCASNGRCETEGNYYTTTRSGVEGNNKVFDHNFQNSNVNTEFAAVPYWILFDTGNFIEIGWLKGELSFGQKSVPWYYRFYRMGFTEVGAFIQQATVGSTTLLKLEDTNADRTWKWWIGTSSVYALIDAPSTRGTPETGLESTDSNIGLTGNIMTDVNNLKYYIGATSYLWENIWIVVNPTNPTNPYYINTCAGQNYYHYQVKKGSTPSC